MSNNPNPVDYANKRNTEYIIEVVDHHTIRLQQIEAMIQGLIEAQRPLLEEWTKIKKEMNG